MSRVEHAPSSASPPLHADPNRIDASNSPAPLLVLDATGLVSDASPAALSLLNRHADDLVGRPFVSLLDDGSRAKAQAILAVAQQGPTTIYELNHVTGDGQVLLIGCQVLPLARTCDDGGPRLLLLLQPVSSAIALAERLIALNRRLDALFTIAARASRSLRLHDSLQQVLDVTVAELDLQAAALFLVDSSSASEAETDIPPFKLAVHHGFADGLVERLSGGDFAPAFAEIAAHDDVYVVNDGVDDLGLTANDFLQPLGPLLSLAIVPLRSENRLVGWLVGISDRYRAFILAELDLLRAIGNLLGPPLENARLFESLLETTAQLQAVLDGIDSGVLLIDRDGVVRYANARLGALLGADVTRWPGQLKHDVLSARLAPRSASIGGFDGEVWEISGPPRRVLRRFTDDVADAQGAPLGTIEVYSDITALEEMNQLKDEFIAAAAHDLKTPVTAVKGYTQIALRLARRLDEPRLVQQLEMVNARSDHLALLMNSLLDLSRIQAGRLNLELDTFDLRELIAHIPHYFEWELQRHERTLSVAQPQVPVEVTWDRARIERVLINLIENAIKYSPDRGEISLGVRTIAGNAVELSVTDHGIGIPPEDRARIFERFYRTQQSIEDGFKGSGLGLYICERVIAAHGGRIWAADALHGGAGTTIHVILPRTVAGPE